MTVGVVNIAVAFIKVLQLLTINFDKVRQYFAPLGAPRIQLEI